MENGDLITALKSKEPLKGRSSRAHTHTEQAVMGKGETQRQENRQ